MDNPHEPQFDVLGGDGMDLSESSLPSHQPSSEPEKSNCAIKPYTWKVSVSQLETLFDDRQLTGLVNLGGLQGFAKALNTSLTVGLDHMELSRGDARATQRRRVDTLWKKVRGKYTAKLPIPQSFATRRAIYGVNYIEPARVPGILVFAWKALKDRTLILLLICAMISIGIGIYEGLVQNDSTSWIEGLAVLVTGKFCSLFSLQLSDVFKLAFLHGTVFIVVLVQSFNDYRKAKQFRFLNVAKLNSTLVTVIRHRHTDVECLALPEKVQLESKEVNVGDIVALAPGDVICADGILVTSTNLLCDESGITGESEPVPKDTTGDAFMVSGSDVLDGIGTMLVVAVGPNSMSGRTNMALRSSSVNNVSEISVKMGKLGEGVARIGAIAGAVVVVVGIIRFLISEKFQSMSLATIMSSIVNILISGVTIIVISVSEGMPVAFTLALGYATLQMLRENNLVRVLTSCETMAHVTRLRILGLARTRFETSPPPSEFDDVGLHDMTLIGIVALEDPLRDQVPSAVRQCQKAGITVRLITGDSRVTAESIARKCHILPILPILPDASSTKAISSIIPLSVERQSVFEGREIRDLTDEKLDQILPYLRVLARTTPIDKQRVVRGLQRLGETVAVTGDGTNDAPALKQADVGFSMGVCGTEVAKEASGKELLWDPQMVNAAVTIASVTSFADSTSEPALNALELLWINLIMDSLAALALATDAPTDALLEAPPYVPVEQAFWSSIAARLAKEGCKLVLANRNERDGIAAADELKAVHVLCRLAASSFLFTNHVVSTLALDDPTTSSSSSVMLQRSTVA
ncbi:hypothetical protein SmJEL517_g03308 [Synchytrium microbalum]|uniref:Cation-transporting P-type ATPase N-terminal domain-containing protein n=1 Tax=Synchytrium microbalum TaxID=1806994 RepID=A0A507C8L7_9FUNG|nr:uncharacterized protein SmJEL517_g03308 [Synchytrium microbalum]TPX33845.1 hypothetical protein SmJEL517_g03308 [Synchytrium microbalum]